MNVIITKKDTTQGSNIKNPLLEATHQSLSSPPRLTLNEHKKLKNEQRHLPLNHEPL